DAVASIVADITTSVLTLILFGAVGAFLLLPQHGQRTVPLLLGLAVSAALVCVFYFLQRAGLFRQLSGLFFERTSFFVRLSQRVMRLVSGRGSDRIIADAAALDQAIGVLYARRLDVLASCAFAFA